MMGASHHWYETISSALFNPEMRLGTTYFTVHTGSATGLKQKWMPIILSAGYLNI